VSQQVISTGTGPNTGTGDPGFTAWTKANANFTELYGLIGGGGTPTFSSVTVNAGPVIGGINVGAAITINGISTVGNVEEFIVGNLNNQWQGLFTRNINAGIAAVNLLEVGNDTVSQELVLYNTSTGYTGTTNFVTGPSAGIGGGGSASQRILTVGPCYRQDQGTGLHTWVSTTNVTRMTIPTTGGLNIAQPTSGAVLTTQATAGNSAIIQGLDATGVNTVAFQAGAAQGFIGSVSNTGFGIFTNNINRLTFDNAGNGIFGGTAITGGLTITVNNTSAVNGDIARIQVISNASVVGLYAVNAATTTPVIANGPTGAQSVLRNLGSFPLVFGVNNTYAGQILSSGGWVIPSNATNTPMTISSNGVTDVLHLDTDSGGRFCTQLFMNNASIRGQVFWDQTTATFNMGSAVAGAVTNIRSGNNVVAITMPAAGGTTVNGAMAMNGQTPYAGSAGWGTPTGTGVIASFPGASATLVQCSQAIATIIAILKNFGVMQA
jgi:hypothetical protein